jgi:3-oxoacyl-[acyl-carrier protein] reductase
MRLRGRKAVVTGGGRGIGRAVAIRFAEEGAHVGVVARTRTELEETASVIESMGGTVLTLPCDLRSAGGIDRMAKACLARFRAIDVLVNNADVFTEPFGVLRSSVENFDETLAVNLRAAWACTKAFARHMPPDGSIINVTSGLGQGPSPSYFPYSLSKWGLDGLTRILAETLPQRVNAVDPGLVATRMTDFSGKPPEDVTEVFVYLASTESKAVRGQVLKASQYPRPA